MDMENGAVGGPTSNVQKDSFPSVLENDHDYCVRSMGTLEQQLAAAESYLQQCEEKVASLMNERFGLQRYANDDALVKFYTGFHSYEMLVNFHRCISCCVEGMRTWEQVQPSKTTKRFRSFASDLDPIDQMFMFLNKLRLGSRDEELADKFNVSPDAVHTNTITWANLLYAILGAQPLWPSRQLVQQFMPSAFRQLYPSTRVILGRVKIDIRSPSRTTPRCGQFSNDEDKMKVKSLVGVTPNGAVSFVSALYADCMSDAQVTKVSGLLDLLEPGDVVMADEGFVIDNVLSERQCSLVTPRFLSRQIRFAVEETEGDQTIEENLRVYVESAGRRFEEFHLFDKPVELNLVGIVTQLWTVACLMTNFQGP